MPTQIRSRLPLSYINVRRIVGIMAMSLPIVMFLGEAILFQTGLQPSISAYYYAGMRWFLPSVVSVYSSSFIEVMTILTNGWQGWRESPRFLPPYFPLNRHIWMPAYLRWRYFPRLASKA